MALWEDFDQDDEDGWWLALLSEPLFAGAGILERAAAARPRWQRQAACRGLDTAMFFPDPGGSTAAAKAVCGRCEVRAPCAQLAAERSERYGVWGGLGTVQRRAAQRKAG